jgi:hypothetical protein
VDEGAETEAPPGEDGGRTAAVEAAFAAAVIEEAPNATGGARPVSPEGEEAGS